MLQKRNVIKEKQYKHAITSFRWNNWFLYLKKKKILQDSGGRWSHTRKVLASKSQLNAFCVEFVPHVQTYFTFIQICYLQWLHVLSLGSPTSSHNPKHDV